MVKNFVIPINKDQLLQQSLEGNYFVETTVSIGRISQCLDICRTAIQEKGADFILEHFDTFFSILVHGDKVDIKITMRGFSRIIKAIEMLLRDMENTFDVGNNLEEHDRVRLLNVNKMLVYLFSCFMSYIDDHILKDASTSYVGKKKTTKSDIEEEWEATREKALEYAYRWLQLPLQKLWQPPIVEDSFVKSITKVCYKILEQCKDAKQKPLRQTIFEILGTSIKKYNEGITCVVRIMQLVKLHDVLAAHIGTGVVHMINECGCTGLIREVMKEIEESEPTEVDSRNVSIFLETIATSQPELIIPSLEDVMNHLACEHYAMRNCAIGILGAVVQKALTGDDLTDEQKERRDECLDNLEEHILDGNAYVRSKVLQVWQRLCCEGAIPLARQAKLLTAASLRLEDKSANVRKQALQLIRALLQSNPFAAKLNKVEISKSLEEEKEKLKMLQTEIACKSGRGDKQRLELWQTLLPDIRKALKQILTDRKEDDDDDDEEDKENEEDIDPNTAFEHIRQLMLDEKIFDAVKYLWKVCTKLKDIPDISNLSVEAKEEYLFILLLKTFMESEDASSGATENVDKEQSAEKTKLDEKIKVGKRVVHYLKSSLEFATELETAITMAENLLFSTTAGDAVEACTLLGTAYQFGVAGASNAIREALLQVFHRDQSVRNNVAAVYKELYLNNDEKQKSERQKALTCAKSLIELFKGLQPGQSPALSQLVSTWYKNQELSSEVLQVFWEKFSMKAPDTTPVDSRAALMLITMIANTQSEIITGNLEVLVKVGLGPRAKTDLLLARDTCRILLKIKNTSEDIETPPVKYTNDHDMFKEIISLLEDNFTNMEEDGYVSFATDAISCVYHLANQPEQLIKQLLVNILKKEPLYHDVLPAKSIPSFLLAKLLYLIGHIAIREMVHLDTSVYKELKRRDTIRKSKSGKNSDKARKSLMKLNTPNSARQIIRNKESSTLVEDNGEEAVEGATDDADAEFINDTLENHIISGDGLLSKFVPLVLDVCRYPDKYNDEDVQAAGSLALSKMMTVSSKFCEESLQLLITIMERSPYSGIRANVLIGVNDLTTRFPNQVEPWMKHVYGRLRDDDVNVRSTCVRVLSSLIMREMVRVRGQVSELALCIVDKESQIRQDAMQFFQELSKKGNALYNVVPDILSRLTDCDLNLDEKDFHDILRHILSLIQKEKQVDAIIDKICSRFKLAATERQCRDFSFCLSLLQFSGKSITRLIESLPLLKDKIHHPQVLKALQIVIEQTKKKPNAKAACTELETKIQELLESTENSEITDSQAMPPPEIPKRRKTGKRSKRKSNSEEEEDDSDSEFHGTPVSKEKSTRKNKASGQITNSDSDEDEIPLKTPRKQGKIQESASSARKVQNRKKSTFPNSSPQVRRNRQVETSEPCPRRTSARLSQSQTKR